MDIIFISRAAKTANRDDRMWSPGGEHFSNLCPKPGDLWILVDAIEHFIIGLSSIKKQVCLVMGRNYCSERSLISAINRIKRMGKVWICYLIKLNRVANVKVIQFSILNCYQQFRIPIQIIIERTDWIWEDRKFCWHFIKNFLLKRHGGPI